MNMTSKTSTTNIGLNMSPTSITRLNIITTTIMNMATTQTTTQTTMQMTIMTNMIDKSRNQVGNLHKKKRT